jgi:hypothetical protein
MFRSTSSSVVLALVAGGALAAPALAQALSVIGHTPGHHTPSVDRNSPISVGFDTAVNQATITPANFRVFGRASGPIAGTFSFNAAGTVVTFTPNQPFKAGEVVMVTLSRNIARASGGTLRSAGYHFEFNARAGVSNYQFQQIGSISNRDATGAQTRIYGGIAADFNRDGWTDIATINEVSADLRVLLNLQNVNTPFAGMVTPYTPIPYESSPNMPADFNSDGFIDVVLSDYDQRIAVALGDGNGGFSSVQEIIVSQIPRDFGVFDADGDGDYDITVACAGGNAINYLANNGNGTFAAPVVTTVTGSPYGMAAADFNNDGIYDLAVGCRNSQEAKILRGNGNGTFTQVSSRAIGGATWVVMAGDLNNDGKVDITAANSFSSNASVLLGNGNGTLQAAAVQPTGGHTVSTDLADLDGDGDLDWIVSSFGAGRWYTYTNNGNGVFTPRDEFPAPANPSCAVPFDFDNDGDIDLALTDEIADVIILMRNITSCDSIDFNQNGVFPEDQDVVDFFDVLAGGTCGACADIDFNNNGVFPEDQDVIDFFNVLAGGGCP